MKQKIERLYLTIYLEKNDLERRLEKKFNDVKSFEISIKNIKEMITYFNDENNKSKKK